MCVNDLIVQGAKPLFFLDYIAVPKINLKKMKSIIKGVVTGCKISDCMLVGGETAEMPGTYTYNKFDLAINNEVEKGVPILGICLGFQMFFSESNEYGFHKGLGLIDGKVVTEHLIWPVGRKRRLVLKVDDSGLQPVADGSDITTVVAYLVDAGGAIKRLSDEYIKFTVNGEGEIIEDENIGVNPQKLLWGEAVALVRSGTEPGIIRLKAELIRDGINSPDFAEIEFSTIKSTHEFLYDEFPNKIVNNKKSNLNEERQKLDDLRIELIKAKKIIQEYELNTVGKQQQKFIE